MHPDLGCLVQFDDADAGHRPIDRPVEEREGDGRLPQQEQPGGAEHLRRDKPVQTEDAEGDDDERQDKRNRRRQLDNDANLGVADPLPEDRGHDQGNIEEKDGQREEKVRPSAERSRGLVNAACQ